MLDIEQQTYVVIPLDKLVFDLKMRRVSESGKKRIQQSIQRVGFLSSYPLTVISLGNGKYRVIDGNHRGEVADEEGITMVPCIIVPDLTEQEQYQLALKLNDATESFVPQTMVTFAELIWKLSDEGYTQEKIAEEVLTEWSREKVAQYASLRQINEEAWQIIVTHFEEIGNKEIEEGVTQNVTRVTFSEKLLRSILSLTAKQQLELVKERINDPKTFTSGKFAERAKNYRARNDMKDYAIQQLGQLGEPYTTRLIDAIYSGAYDTEWINSQDTKKKEHGLHPKLDKLIKGLQDEWQEKNSFHPICGDFYKKVKKVGDGSIDLIITDPPYNVARDNEFEYEGRTNVSQDFGEWDKYEHLDFISLFDVWAREWFRILREQGSGYVFTSDSYISHLRTALEDAGLHVKATVVWHKTNPGTQPVKTNFKSSVEYVLFFTKGKGGHTFNWQGENEMHNFIQTPICAGKERVKDAKGSDLHPTQKPEQVIKHFMEISSNGGDMVFDGFAGVFTTSKVAKDLGRKSIGIEQDQTYYEAGKRRVEG